MNKLFNRSYQIVTTFINTLLVLLLILTLFCVRIFVKLARFELMIGLELTAVISTRCKVRSFLPLCKLSTSSYINSTNYSCLSLSWLCIKVFYAKENANSRFCSAIQTHTLWYRLQYPSVNVYLV